MLRTVALGLLISGITPIALASSTTLSLNDNPEILVSLKASCKKLVDLPSCSTKTNPIKQEIYADLWFRGITQSLLSNSPFLLCNQRSPAKPIKRQLWRKNFSLSSLGTIANSTCSFSWQKQLSQQLIPLNYGQKTSIALKQNTIHNYVDHQKFPQLSRSSLIVSFPHQDSSFVPQNSKLANPAPETKRIASPFGWRTRPYSNQLQFHQGIDYGAPFGSTVVSVGNGIVTKVVQGCADFGNLFCGGQLGNWIEIDHGNGVIGTYGHLKQSSINVAEGSKVSKNQSIAEVGSSGWSTGAHLDFRLKVNGEYENPAKYVSAIKPSQTKQGQLIIK